MMTVNQQDNQVMIHCQGEWTIYQAAALATDLLQKLAQPGDVTLDLSQVTALDSAGMQLLLSIQTLCKYQQRPLQIVHPHANIMPLFELMDLAHPFIQQEL